MTAFRYLLLASLGLTPSTTFGQGYFYRNPNTGQSYGQSYNYSSGWRLDYRNPYTGMTYSYGQMQSYAGMTPYFGGYSSSPSYGYSNPYGYGNPMYGYSPYMMGGFGGANNPANNPVIQEQVRQLRTAVRSEVNDVEARKMLLDQMAFERGGKELNPVKARANAKAIEALLNPTDERILAGVAVNDIVEAIAKKSPNPKEQGAFLPGHLLARVEFQGGAFADVLMLLRSGHLEYPAIYDRKEFRAVRNELDKHTATILDALAAGQKVDPLAADRLAGSIASARLVSATVLRDLPMNEALAVAKFHARLDRFAKLSATPEMRGFEIMKWSSTGMTASELVNVLQKNKIRVGAADSGDENAYFALHRGLAACYATLLDKK